MQSIFYYEELPRYLKDVLGHKKQSNNSFSIRSWANKLGMKSHGPLQQAMAGKRGIPSKYVPALCADLKLNEKEALYLEALAQLQAAQTESEKVYLYGKLKASGKKEAKDKFKVYIDGHRFFNNPLYGIIRSLIRREDFNPGPAWIQRQLTFKASQVEIRQAIADLLEMNLIEETETGYRNLSLPLTNKEDLPSEAVKNYHRKMSQLAAEQITLQPVEVREFNSFTMNLNPQQLPAIKQKMRSFISELMEEYETHSQAETYQVNLQLFKLAHKENNT